MSPIISLPLARLPAPQHNGHGGSRAQPPKTMGRQTKGSAGTLAVPHRSSLHLPPHQQAAPPASDEIPHECTSQGQTMADLGWKRKRKQGTSEGPVPPVRAQSLWCTRLCPVFEGFGVVGSLPPHGTTAESSPKHQTCFSNHRSWRKCPSDGEGASSRGWQWVCSPPCYSPGGKNKKIKN